MEITLRLRKQYNIDPRELEFNKLSVITSLVEKLNKEEIERAKEAKKKLETENKKAKQELDRRRRVENARR